MRKRFACLTLALLCCLAALPAPAWAESTDAAPAEAAPADAMPAGAVRVPLPENTYLYSFLPLEDGVKVVAGYRIFPGQPRETRTTDPVHPQETERTEAYAACLAPDGSTRWTLTLSDPQAINGFRAEGLLPDGRILLRLDADEGTFGTQHFIVSRDGLVEAMLDRRAVAEAFPPKSLTLTPAGYVGGDSTVVDDHYDRHFNPIWDPVYDPCSRDITLLDFDLTPLWTLDMRAFSDAPSNYAFLGLEGATLLYGSTKEGPEDADWRASAMLVDADGSVRWRHVEEGYKESWYSAALPLADGILLAGSSWGATDRHTPMLHKLSPQGDVLFTVITNQDGPVTLEIAPLSDGYVQRSVHDLNNIYLSYCSPDGDYRGSLLLRSTAEMEHHWTGLAEGADGVLYLHGMLLAVDPDMHYGYRPEAFYYLPLTEESFKR